MRCCGCGGGGPIFVSFWVPTVSWKSVHETLPSRSLSIILHKSNCHHWNPSHKTRCDTWEWAQPVPWLPHHCHPSWTWIFRGHFILKRVNGEVGVLVLVTAFMLEHCTAWFCTIYGDTQSHHHPFGQGSFSEESSSHLCWNNNDTNQKNLYSEDCT